MEFSLEHVEQAVVFSPRDAIVVNIPDPARFALHKLIVYGERRGSFRAKAMKDLAQAAHLLDALWSQAPSTIEHALDDLRGRGRQWNRAVDVGVEALRRHYPSLAGNEPLMVLLSGRFVRDRIRTRLRRRAKGS
jgi:hypothetical protein